MKAVEAEGICAYDRTATDANGGRPAPLSAAVRAVPNAAIVICSRKIAVRAGDDPSRLLMLGESLSAKIEEWEWEGGATMHVFEAYTVHVHDSGIS